MPEERIGREGVLQGVDGVSADAALDGQYGGIGLDLERHLERLTRQLRAVMETVQACREVLSAAETTRQDEIMKRQGGVAAVATPAIAAVAASTAACGRVTSFVASMPLAAPPVSSSTLSSSPFLSSRPSLSVPPTAANDRGTCASSTPESLSSASAASVNGGAGALLPRIDGALGETGWSLLRDGWVLVAPDGFRLRLNLCERAILGAMVCAPQHALSLAGLMELLTQTRSNFGQKPLATSSMRMILMRLMKKLERSSAPCPILSVHGWGYRLRVGDESVVRCGQVMRAAGWAVAASDARSSIAPSMAPAVALSAASSFGEPVTASLPDASAGPAATPAATASRAPAQPNSLTPPLRPPRGGDVPVRASVGDRTAGAAD
ncbi:MAG: helix-turn-helix domain-containing protein [Pseudacidovorax sp.]|nr:helix-turn-helix domain-containing protein [Pseudacidovorax sp.]